MIQGEMEVSFLHPHGPAQSFKYPIQPDILTVNTKDTLTTVNLTTTTGSTYTMTKHEEEQATGTLETRKNYRHN